MYYSQDDDIKFEIGDLVCHSNTYDRHQVIEVVTFVGSEGVVLLSLGGIKGMLERYVRFKQISNGWPRIIHKRDAEEYAEFLEATKKEKS